MAQHWLKVFQHSLKVPQHWLNVSRQWLKVPQHWLNVSRQWLKVPQHWLNVSRQSLNLSRVLGSCHYISTPHSSSSIRGSKFVLIEWRYIWIILAVVKCPSSAQPQIYLHFQMRISGAISAFQSGEILVINRTQTGCDSRCDYTEIEK